MGFFLSKSNSVDRRSAKNQGNQTMGLSDFLIGTRHHVFPFFIQGLTTFLLLSLSMTKDENKSFYTMNLRILFLLSLLLLSSSELMAQANSLAGTWRVEVGRTIDLMDNSDRSRFDTLSSDVKDRAVKAMTGREFHFSQDGNITVKWNSRSGARESIGSWLVQSGDLFITIGERATGFSYEFPSESALILKGKEEKGFFDNLYLEKIN